MLPDISKNSVALSELVDILIPIRGFAKNAAL
jgi:hypothetical protein